MAISRYFGLPGCGKTTILAYLAKKAADSGRYENVYSNVHLTVPGVIYVPFDLFGVYEFENGLYLVDEAAVVCGDRDYKNLGQHRIKVLMEHRHHDLDLVFFSQEPDGMDKKIRSITDRVYYVNKGFFTGNWITNIYRVPYKIIWPKGDGDGENAGKILMGYIKPPWFCRLFAKRLYRPKYYQYFDSWECDKLPPLPPEYQPYALPPAADLDQKK